MTVDDDLLLLAKQRALELAVPVSEVINRALRRGLAADTAIRAGEPTLTYGEPGDPCPDEAALRAVAARLDDEELLRKLRP